MAEWNEQTARAQIERLAIDESFSRSLRLDLDKLTRGQLQDVTDNLRSSMQSPTRRAHLATGNEYRIESGEWRTRNRDTVVTVIVTRLG